MFDRCTKRASVFCLFLAFAATLPRSAPAQAALLMEEPYGFFGSVNPTGHTAIYFERICAESPVKLRRCQPGEMGAVVSRYQGIDGYDWVAIPLIPYLYAVDNAADAPAHADRATVAHLRNRYHERNLLSLGEDLSPGDFFHGGWTQLAGLSYERRIYAFRFQTTAEQDDALIARLNAAPNRTHFSLLYSNCADFARGILNIYYPGSFKRSIFPDAGMTTPKQIAYKLARLNRKHPQMQLTVYEIPQIPGYRRNSRSNKDVAESLATTAYAVPIAVFNPYLAGGLAVDYVIRGRYRIVPKHPQVLTPLTIEALHVSPLTDPSSEAENPTSAAQQVPGAATEFAPQEPAGSAAQSGLMEIKASHE